MALFFFVPVDLAFFLLFKKPFAIKSSQISPSVLSVMKKLFLYCLVGANCDHHNRSYPSWPPTQAFLGELVFHGLPTTPAWEAKDAKPQHDFARSMFFNSAEINVNKIDAT